MVREQARSDRLRLGGAEPRQKALLLVGIVVRRRSVEILEKLSCRAARFIIASEFWKSAAQLLGLVYTLKVFDIIWIMTKGGPTDSSTTLATWSYRLGFGNLLPRFGPGAAVGNLLVVAALVFGLVYVRVQRKQALS